MCMLLLWVHLSCPLLGVKSQVTNFSKITNLPLRLIKLGYDMSRNQLQ